MATAIRALAPPGAPPQAPQSSDEACGLLVVSLPCHGQLPGRQTLWQISVGDRSVAAEDGGVFDDVGEFPDVAGPLVGGERLQRRGR